MFCRLADLKSEGKGDGGNRHGPEAILEWDGGGGVGRDFKGKGSSIVSCVISWLAKGGGARREGWVRGEGGVRGGGGDRGGRERVVNASSVVVSLSGGVDSMVLCEALRSASLITSYPKRS